jgi:hypothetical protein
MFNLKQPLQRELSLTTAITSSLPTSIWDKNNSWSPPASTDNRSYRIEDFTSTVYQAATRGLNPIPQLNIEAPSLEQLVDRFSDLIDEASAEGDFSLILSPDRHFTM